MICDQPLVVYKKDKGEASTKAKADALADEWAKKHAKRKEGEKISLSELFGGENVTKVDNPLKK